MATSANNDGRVFVFGSNLQGAHGAGAAAFALEHRGAVYGEGIGHHGQSYAIPTMHGREFLAQHVAIFLDYARANPQLRFEVTKIGCGIAGFTEAQVAPLFADAPTNCDLPEGW
jgi:hypothetical protein